MALTVKVDPGKHTIRITKPGYFPIKFDITVEAGKTYNISRTLIPTNAVTIQKVEITPSSPKKGDKITVKVTVKNNTSTTLKCRLRVWIVNVTIIGNPTFSLGAKATYTWTGTWTADRTGSLRLRVAVDVHVEEHENGADYYETDSTYKDFTVSERKATITITTSPSGASVYVDGKYVGTT